MTSNDHSVSASNKTTFLFANAASNSPAATKPELQLPIVEEGEEWEGFYDDDQYEDF